jgi:hypothetical protein
MVVSHAMGDEVYLVALVRIVNDRAAEAGFSRWKKMTCVSFATRGPTSQPEFADAAVMAGSANMPLRSAGEPPAVVLGYVHVDPQTGVMAGLVASRRVYPTCVTR